MELETRLVSMGFKKTVHIPEVGQEGCWNYYLHDHWGRHKFQVCMTTVDVTLYDCMITDPEDDRDLHSFKFDRTPNGIKAFEEKLGREMFIYQIDPSTDD